MIHTIEYIQYIQYFLRTRVGVPYTLHLVGVHYHLNPKVQFFLLEGGRGTSTIISFNLINTRHHLGVLIILALFDILWAVKDLLWP